MYDYDVIIVGGGLAGLTAAIHLSQKNHSVLVIEKKQYPHHKVCGEYVSNEVIPYLKKLNIPLHSLNVAQIENFQISTSDGKTIQTKLPLGGIGISRYALDNLLYKKALANGVRFVFESVDHISFKNLFFQVVTNLMQSYTSNVVIGSYGKRSLLDKQLNRGFVQQKSGWLAVKSHYHYDNFPDDLVALHNFKGGYGGLSKTETGAVNFCYLASYESFQAEKGIENYNENVVAGNPFLRDFLNKATPIFEEPLTIAQIYFDQKQSVEDHILMCGDAAGLIHPLCGNGMAMAIHSAKIASECIHNYLSNENYSRLKLESDYHTEWNKMFKQRLWMGRKLQTLLLNETMSNIALKVAVISPVLLRQLIRTTHGKPLLC